jgi:hypothetical protein
MGKRGTTGSPRLKAAVQLANDPSLDTVDALVNAGYRHVDITHTKRKDLSRQKLHFKKDIERRIRRSLINDIILFGKQNQSLSVTMVTLLLVYHLLQIRKYWMMKTKNIIVVHCSRGQK